MTKNYYEGYDYKLIWRESATGDLLALDDNDKIIVLEEGPRHNHPVHQDDSPELLPGEWSSAHNDNPSPWFWIAVLFIGALVTYAAGSSVAPNGPGW